MITNIYETETIKDIILKDFTYSRSAIYCWFLGFFRRPHYASVLEKNKQALALRERVAGFSSEQDDFFEVLGEIFNALKGAYWKIYAMRIQGGERTSETQVNELNHGQFEEQLINCLRKLYNYLNVVEVNKKDSPDYSRYSNALKHCRQIHDQFLSGLTDSSKIMVINQAERFAVTAEGNPIIRYTASSAVNLTYSSTVAASYRAANFVFIPENRVQPLNIVSGSNTLHISSYFINGENRDELGEEQTPLLTATPSASATSSSRPAATTPSAPLSAHAAPRVTQRYQLTPP